MFGPTYPPRDSTAVIEVFQSRVPGRPYIEIARIQVGDTDDDWSLRQIRRKARELGADAVIITGRVGSFVVGSAAVAAGENYGLAAIAIRFREP